MRQQRRELRNSPPSRFEAKNMWGSTPTSPWIVMSWCYSTATEIDSSWNVMAHGDTREGKWRGNWRMERVVSTLHTTSEHGVSSITTITTADAHTSAAISRLNWSPRRFKWTCPFRRKNKSGFGARVITFQTQSMTSMAPCTTTSYSNIVLLFS